MSATEMFFAAPPVTRTIVAATVVESVLVHVVGILKPYQVIYYTPYLYSKFPPQLWRLFTSFALSGSGLGLILDPFWLWNYGSWLERDSPRFQTKRGDFFVYVAFVASVILILDGTLLGGYTFLQPLSLAFAYTYAQDNAQSKISFFIITIAAKYLPYAMLALSFTMAGPEAAMHQGTGLLAAHLYDFLTRIYPSFLGGKNVLATPKWVRKAFGEGAPGTRQSNIRGFGGAVQAGQGQAGQRVSGQSSGWSSAFSAWGSKGRGRRLGGD